VPLRGAIKANIGGSIRAIIDSAIASCHHSVGTVCLASGKALVINEFIVPDADLYEMERRFNRTELHTQ
jgi:hypothetical protein